MLVPAGGAYGSPGSSRPSPVYGGGVPVGGGLAAAGGAGGAGGHQQGVGGSGTGGMGMGSTSRRASRVSEGGPPGPASSTNSFSSASVPPGFAPTAAAAAARRRHVVAFGELPPTSCDQSPATATASADDITIGMVSDSGPSFSFRLSAGSSVSGPPDSHDRDLSKDPLFSKRDSAASAASAAASAKEESRLTQLGRSRSAAVLAEGAAATPAPRSSPSAGSRHNHHNGLHGGAARAGYGHSALGNSNSSSNGGGGGGGGDGGGGGGGGGGGEPHGRPPLQNRHSNSSSSSGGGGQSPLSRNHSARVGGSGVSAAGGSRTPRMSEPASSLPTASPGASAASASAAAPAVRQQSAPLGPLPEGPEGGVLQLRKSTENAKMAILTKRMEQEAECLSKCELMLGMFVNRANAAWAEQQRGAWRPGQAALIPASDLQQLEASDEFRVYRADLVRKLRNGQVVFQIFAAEAELVVPGSNGAAPTTLDLWTSDPWNVVAAARPGSMPMSGERLEGLPMGGRVLTQLRAAVEAAAGAEAAAALTVVLHLHEGQRQAALRDLTMRKMYGLRRENVYVTVQRRRSGYRYDPYHGLFVSLDDAASQRSLGPGYAMMQLCWVSDAFQLGEAGDASPTPLPGSLLEALQKRGVEWLVSRRCSDLSLFSSESALDLTALTHVLHLRDKARATMVAEVAKTQSTTTMRQLDRRVLPNVSSVVMSVRPSSSNASLNSSYGPIKAVKLPQQGVVELRGCELASTSMVDAVAQVRAEAPGNELLVGLHRYAFHLPSLAVILSDINVFRPKLALNGASVHIALELSDLTAAPRARCLALLAAPNTLSGAAAAEASGTGGGSGGGGGAAAAAPLGPAAPLLSSAAEVEDLVALLQVQDRDLDFRRAIAGTRSASIRYHEGAGPPMSRSAGHLSVPGAAAAAAGAGAASPPLAGRASGGSAPNGPLAGGARQRIVVFCADNDATQTAVEFVSLFARPGRDEVFLMTVVQSDMHHEAGEQLMTPFFRILSRNSVQPRVDVVSKGYSGLIDCLESYATNVDATLVVMGSQAITGQAAANGAAASFAAGATSVTLSCMKRLQLPMVIVTANTRLQAADGRAVGSTSMSARSSAGGGRGEKTKVMAVVEAHSKGMLQYLCGNGMADPLRGDKLYLAQVFPSGRGNLTAQQQGQSKRLMDTFADVAAGHHLPPTKCLLEGPFDKALHAQADTEGLHLLALQLKPGEKSIPPEVLNLMRSCKAAILMYRDARGTSNGGQH